MALKVFVGYLLVNILTAVQIEHLDTGFLFENVGRAYVEENTITVRSYQPLRELKRSINNLIQIESEIITACNSTAGDSYHDCGSVREQLDQELTELSFLFDLTQGEKPRKGRGLGDIAMGIFGLEFIDPTRVENVNRLNKNQGLLTSHIEGNAHAINDQIKVIHTMKHAIEDQTKYVNAGIQRYNKMVNTVKDDLKLLTAKAMTFDWLLASFFDHATELKVTLNDILNNIGTTQSVSEGKARTLLRNESMWREMRLRLGVNFKQSLSAIQMTVDIQDGQLVRDFELKIFHSEIFHLIHSIQVPRIDNGSIFIPDSTVNWVILGAKVRMYSPMKVQNQCEKIKDYFLCEVPFFELLSHDSDCAVKHMFNTKQSNCSHYTLSHEKGYFQRLLSGSFLFVKPRPTTVYLNCDKNTSKIAIEDVGIIKIPVDCKLIDGDVMFEAKTKERSSIVTHFRQLDQVVISNLTFKAIQTDKPFVMDPFEDHLNFHIKKIENPVFHKELYDMMQPYVASGVSVTGLITLFLIVYILQKTGCLGCIRNFSKKQPRNTKRSKRHNSEFNQSEKPVFHCLNIDETQQDLKPSEHIIDIPSATGEIQSIIRKDQSRITRHSLLNASVRET